MKKGLHNRVAAIINSLRIHGLYPDIRIIEGKSTGRKVKITGKESLLFCGYDYLGLSSDERIIKRYKEGLDTYGTQTGGTPLVSGTLDVHKAAEKKIAGFVGKEAALLFTSGALANIGVIPALMSVGDATLNTTEYIKNLFRAPENGTIFSDEFNHATIVDGCRLSKARISVYKHKDIDDLRQKLKEAGKSKWKLIITDGVFSMDGDIAPLPQLAELAKQYDAWLMVDDAHAVGVMGDNGGGTPDFFKLQKEVDIVTGALGKAFGLLGGYAATSPELAEYLRISVRPAIFSGSLPPPLALALVQSLDIVKSEDGRNLRRSVHQNAARLRNGLNELGLDTLLSEDPVPIIPLLVADDIKAIALSREMENRGIFAPAIRWPAVPKGSSRIRFTVQANQLVDDIDFTLSEIRDLDKQFRLPKKKK